jgi:hypothetical protein
VINSLPYCIVSFRCGFKMAPTRTHIRSTHRLLHNRTHRLTWTSLYNSFNISIEILFSSTFCCTILDLTFLSSCVTLILLVPSASRFLLTGVGTDILKALSYFFFHHFFIEDNPTITTY